jgi:hypothetical protein
MIMQAGPMFALETSTKENHMKQINKLAMLFTQLVLILGLSACSSDNEATTNPKKTTAWGVGKVLLLREGKRPILLKEARKSEVEYKISDQIVFADQDQVTAARIQLHIEALCDFDKNKLPAFKFTEPLQSQYSIYELLPLDSILKLDNQSPSKLTCTIMFQLKSENGSSQNFDLSNINIIAAELRNSLEIQSDLESTEKNGVLNLSLDQLKSFSLPQLQNNFQYRLQCQSVLAEGQSSLNDRFSFNHFIFTYGEPNYAPEYCRVAEVRIINGRTTKLSNIFILRPANKYLHVESISKGAAIQAVPVNNRLLIGQYRITNISDSDIAVALNSGANNLIKYTPVFTLYGHRVGTEVIGKVAYQVVGSKSVNRDNFLRFKIPVRKSVVVKLLSTHTTFRCTDVHLLGVHYATLNPDGLMLYATSSTEGGLTSLTTLEEVQIEKPFERYYYYERTPVFAKNRPPPEKRPGKIHHLKNNFCSEY